MRQYLEAGKIVTTHGVHGEVRVYVWCDSAALFCRLKKIYLDDAGRQALDVEAVRPHKNMALLKLKGFDSIETSRKLIDRILYLDREDISLPEGTHFVSDLIGMQVVDADTPDRHYGSLIDVTDNGAHDVYHIQMADGKIGMVPAAGGMVVALDFEKQEIQIRPVKGLLDDAD